MEPFPNADQIQKRASETLDSINDILMESAKTRRRSSLLYEKCQNIISGPKIQMSDEFYKQIAEMERLEAEERNIQSNDALKNPSQSHDIFESDNKSHKLENWTTDQKPKILQKRKKSSILDCLFIKKDQSTSFIPEETHFSEDIDTESKPRVTSARNYFIEKSEATSSDAYSKLPIISNSKPSPKIVSEQTRKSQTRASNTSRTSTAPSETFRRSISSVKSSEKSRKSVTSTKSSDSKKKILKKTSAKQEEADVKFQPTPVPSARSSIVGTHDKRVDFDLVERQASLDSFQEIVRHKIRSRRQTPLLTPTSNMPNESIPELMYKSSIALEALANSNTTWKARYYTDDSDVSNN